MEAGRGKELETVEEEEREDLVVREGEEKTGRQDTLEREDGGKETAEA